jgi:hypothetical protein
MSEATSFPVFPNINAAQYIQTLIQLSGYLDRENPDFRSLREQLRTWNIWERERGKEVLRFLMVSLDDLEKIPTGRLLSELGSRDDVEAQQDLLFDFFNDRNPFLMKTIFSALDSENDGRIQSTNELYKIVTSYIYPGQRMTLPDFRDWIGWMEAIEVIRLVGIRWGFGETATRHVAKLQQIDIEELVEDFNDGMFNKWTSQAPDSDDSLPEPGVTAPVETTPAPTEVDEDFEEMPDMPNEAPIPDEIVVAAAEAALGIEAQVAEEPLIEPHDDDPDSGEVVVLPPPGEKKRKRTKGILQPVPNPNPQRSPGSVKPGIAPPSPVLPAQIAPVFLNGGTRLGAPLSDDQCFANAKMVREWWEGYVYRQPYRAQDFGVSLGEDTNKNFYDLSVAALFANRPEGGTAAVSALNALRESGIVESFYDGSADLSTAIEQAGVLGLVGGDGRFLDLVPKIMHVALATKSLKLTFKSLKKHNPCGLIEHLHVKVFGRSDVLAPFWAVREALLGGVTERADLEAVASVPSKQSRENALRLGFVSKLYAEDLNELVSLSKELARFFGPETDYSAPLDHLQDQLGCRFRCPFAQGCGYDCREKTAF